MEMVSAAKMRKAVYNVQLSRSYADLAWDLVKRLVAKTATKHHSLLRKPPVIKRVGVVLVTSNRGLCGGFNTQIIHKTLNYIKDQENQGAKVELIILGKKGGNFMVKRRQAIVAVFEKLDITTQIAEIRPLIKLLLGDYLAGKYDKIVLAYSDFISTLVQRPRIFQLLPVSGTEDRYLGQIRGSSQKEESFGSYQFEYLFEPSPEEVLNELLPRLLEMQIYQAILESDASEHSARMVAMRNASDAASEMIDDLTLAFNKARQASITAELADICGGKIAIE